MRVEELKAGVVGTGFIGAVHLDGVRRLGVEVLGVVGSTPERARAKELAPVYDSYEALLADGRVDVVHVTTPNYLHFPQVRDALAAGKHVVCEKPLVTTSAESAFAGAGDGEREAVEAVSLSNRERRWVEVTQ